ncbi:WD repeat and HMG-box DNA-binding protein 1 [Chionoecetes opilio]|uniref:WD repeat and HMG-box DNA-binding protein 1 n=1 Tax=Chionoecetes opilio TaxID=41210 RepID=A0A8J4YD86_CHIOP|nr:WD repeat and HMG-box DNA-binding protein 1 [Chionoecetes opilio]
MSMTAKVGGRMGCLPVIRFRRVLAGACMDGTMALWSVASRRVLTVIRHPKCVGITGLAWHPDVTKREFAIVDITGQLGTVVDVPLVEESEVEEGSVVEASGAAGEGEEPPFPPMDDDDDDAEYSLSKIKAEMGFNDADGSFLGIPDPASASDGASAQGPSGSSSDGPWEAAAPPRPRAEGPSLPRHQEPFQPGMTPHKLSHRFMIDGPDESAIDVEFHDASVHHSLYINNTAAYTMATLSTQVPALARGHTEDEPSLMD